MCSIVLSFVLCTTHSRDLINPYIITHISMCTLWEGPLLESICVVPLFPDYILSSIERYHCRELYILVPKCLNGQVLIYIINILVQKSSVISVGPCTITLTPDHKHRHSLKLSLVDRFATCTLPHVHILYNCTCLFPILQHFCSLQ